MAAAFVIDRQDNVATALSRLEAGRVALRGDAADTFAEVTQTVPAGHKLALTDIPEGGDIIKYGVRIGIATQRIPRGSWVHLQVMRSAYDERSSHLDSNTGAPRDIRYD